MSSQFHLKLLLMPCLLTALYSLPAVAQAVDASCTTPMDSSFPKLEVIVPQMLELSNGDTKIKYNYLVKFNYEAPRYGDELVFNSRYQSPKLLGLLGKTSTDGNKQFVSVDIEMALEVQYSGSFSVDTITQKFHQTVDTAGLCLPTPVIHWQEIHFVAPEALGIDKLRMVQLDYKGRDGRTIGISAKNGASESISDHEFKLKVAYLDTKISAVNARVVANMPDGKTTIGPRLEYSLSSESDLTEVVLTTKAVSHP